MARVHPLRYGITDLGTLPRGKWSRASGINEQGQVAGTADHASGYSRAFLWHKGKMTDLGVLAGSYSTGQAINAKAQVVGESNNHAFLWQRGRMKDLGTLPDGGRCMARAINDRADVVGDVLANEHRAAHAFLWRNGRMRDLGTLPGGKSSAALGINHRGQVVGGGHWEKGRGNVSIQYAFLWEEKRGMRALGTLKLPGRFYHYSFATAINDRGQIVGESDRRAFLWQDGKMRDLGVLPEFGWWIRAHGINNQGHVVGRASSPRDGCAFLFSQGSIMDLNQLIPAGSGWKLESAEGINEHGQIVGQGRFRDQIRAVLLTPQ